MKAPMKLNHLTDAPVKELFFLISPPRHIISDVSVLKDDVHYLIGRQPEDRHSPAHISLFKYNGDHMDDMVRFVRTKASKFKPFNVFLKGFGVFYHGSKRTIYMDIVYKSPIQEIFEKLVREDAGYIPHIPIARNLPMEDFLRCWPYFENLNYNNQHFLCDRITVLARSDKRWMHYTDIMFSEH